MILSLSDLGVAQVEFLYNFSLCFFGHMHGEVTLSFFFLSSVSFFGKADQCIKLPSGSLKTQTSVISSDNPVRLTPQRNRTK